MSSQHFQKLYQQASQREHVVLLRTMSLWNGMYKGVEKADWLATTRIAEGLIEAQLDFEEDIANLAVEKRMRVRRLPYPIACPVCGAPECPAAEPIVPVITVLGSPHPK